MPPKNKYTDPQLRDQVKEEVQQSDKGGAPGQWSARKAQFMASEYKKRGGSYTTDKKDGQDESQKNLDKWSSEDWQTKEGSGEAKKSDGSRKRYLPKKAWEQMDDKEKEETDQKKQAESKEGKQFVGNTDKAKGARKNVSESKGQKGKANGNKKTPQKEDDEEEEEEGEHAEHAEEQGNEEVAEEVDGKKQAGQKRGRSKKADDDDDDDADREKNDKAPSTKRKRKDDGKNEADVEQGKVKQKQEQQQQQQSSDNKKKKTDGPSKKSSATMGSKHDSAEAPAPQGSAKRLPKKGQKVTWKAMPGWVHGTVLEVVTQSKSMEGKSVKASKEDPRIALKADSGKFCVHKPDACYFEDA